MLAGHPLQYSYSNEPLDITASVCMYVCRVLLKDTSGIPEERLQLLQDSVASYHGVGRGQLTVEIIQAAADIDPRYELLDFRGSLT